MRCVFLVGVIALMLSACESNPPAPVVDRKPQSTKSKAVASNTKNSTASKTNNGKDWRPDSYIVKKGDTLFTIGLEYGFEYKEIASANQINPPYLIQVGQKLNLAGLKSKAEADVANASAQTPNEEGVVVTPMNSLPASTMPELKSAESKPVQPTVTPILREPKALRETYSLEAFNKIVPVKTAENKVPETSKPAATLPAASNSVEAKPAENKPINAADPMDDEAIKWSWPTQGKVLANFNESTNKGLDIGGKTGQAIFAASNGKVIYSGSDLRGYGKLVIIKHNKTYLSVYAHNSKIIVKEGQVVALGQKIAEMGDTDANSVKLHFEIRRLGKSVDPIKYLNQN